VNENTFRAEYRKSRGALTARLNYAFSERRGDYNENAFLAETPMANQVPAGAHHKVSTPISRAPGLPASVRWRVFPAHRLLAMPQSTTPNNNTVPQASTARRNILNEIPGFRRYYVADRDRNDTRAQTQRSQG
jgi:hypothetical protein